MPSAQIAAVCACIASAIATAGWSRASRRIEANVAKLTASLSFVALGSMRLGAGELDAVIYVGLVLGAIGDALLLVRARGAFRAGLGAFLAGHGAYAADFARQGVSLVPSLVAALAFGLAIVPLWRWGAPGLRRARMVVPVAMYFLTIGAMVALAVGASFVQRRPIVALAALLFAASDVAVARERFVVASPNNRTWGLPLYYAAQLLFAAT